MRRPSSISLTSPNTTHILPLAPPAHPPANAALDPQLNTRAHTIPHVSTCYAAASRPGVSQAQPTCVASAAAASTTGSTSPPSIPRLPRLHAPTSGQLHPLQHLACQAFDCPHPPASLPRPSVQQVNGGWQASALAGIGWHHHLPNISAPPAPARGGMLAAAAYWGPRAHTTAQRWQRVCPGAHQGSAHTMLWAPCCCRGCTHGGCERRLS